MHYIHACSLLPCVCFPSHRRNNTSNIVREKQKTITGKSTQMFYCVDWQYHPLEQRAKYIHYHHFHFILNILIKIWLKVFTHVFFLKRNH